MHFRVVINLQLILPLSISIQAHQNVCLMFSKDLSKIEDSGKTITINWYYEEGDDDMMEAGEDYSDLLDLDFNFREIEED